MILLLVTHRKNQLQRLRQIALRFDGGECRLAHSAPEPHRYGGYFLKKTSMTKRLWGYYSLWIKMWIKHRSINLYEKSDF